MAKKSPGLVTLELELTGLYLESISIAGRQASRLSLPDQIRLKTAGLPEVPILARSLAIPGSGEIRLRLLENVVTELVIDPVEPSKGHLDRNRDPASVPPVFSEFYADGGVWPAESAVLGEPFILRDHRGVNVRLQPLRYDASTGRLLISTRMVLEVMTTQSGSRNKIWSTPGISSSSDSEFSTIYDRLFGSANTSVIQEKYNPLPTRGRMLIVTDADFIEDLEPFRQWKQRLGIIVAMRTTAEIGDTAEAIRLTLQEFYDEPEGLTWVILVGDKEQVPTNIGLYDGSDSDSRYALLAGDDEYPDIYVSRISARSRNHVQTQVAKFIAYEKQPASGDQANWYGRASGIAGNEGIPSDHERVDLLRVDLLEYGFHTVDRFYQDLGGTTAGIRIALEEGCSLVNYLGHGTGLGWSSVPFTNLDVQNLSNPGRTPWVVDVSCSNGDFHLNECFAETWLRAGSPEEPRGAVAFISSTSLTPWVPPTVMQAEIIDLLTARQSNTLGSLYYGGLMKVLDLYAGLSVATKVMEQTVVFGDCSMMVRTRPPEKFQVTHSGLFDENSTTWTAVVESPSPSLTGSVVTLTRAGLLFGTGFVAPGGQVEVLLNRSAADIPQLDLTISGFNMTPFLGVVNVSNGEISILDSESETDPVRDPTVDPLALNQARLMGNHPNPFNPETIIVFELPRSMHARLRVFDIRGRLVTTLVDENLNAGRREVVWNGRNQTGAEAASGIYLYRLETETGALSGRMILSK